MADTVSKALTVALWWSLVFALNLPFALLLGLALTGHEGGRGGMWAGVWLLWAAGAFACCLFESAHTTLLYGGALVALSQFFPIAQLFAGLFAQGVWEAFCGPGRPEQVWSQELHGFTLTLITGQLMLAAAGVVGLMFRAVSGRRVYPKTDAGVEQPAGTMV